MAKTVVLYPYADVTLGHSASGTGYSKVNEARGSYDTTNISHSLSKSSSTKTSTFKCDANSSQKPAGKIRINSISGGETYTRLNASGVKNVSVSLTVTSTINGGSSSAATAGTFTSSSSSYSTQSFSLNSQSGAIYSSIQAADIRVTVTSSGSYTEDKNASGTFYISAVNLTLSYDDVFTCAASVVSGNGISSASVSSSEVVSGSNCTFTAVVMSGYRFVGWYTSSSFTGTAVSTSTSYTRSITANTTLYPKAERVYNVILSGHNCTYSATPTSGPTGTSVTVKVNSVSSGSTFTGWFLSDSSGYPIGSVLSTSTEYTTTISGADIYLYASTDVLYTTSVVAENCTISSGSHTAPAGTQLTFSVTSIGSEYEWSGWYSDARHTIRLSTSQTYTFQNPSENRTIYAWARLKKQLFVKVGDEWVGCTKAYVKENGTWVEKQDITGIFNQNKTYKRND